MKKIQCGGFYVDDEAIETREGKPFLKTGGGGGAMVVYFDLNEDMTIGDASATLEEVNNAKNAGTPVTSVLRFGGVVLGGYGSYCSLNGEWGFAPSLVDGEVSFIISADVNDQWVFNGF